ncbi:MAG: hypothetical protein JXD22_11690 [Sedimentisphaerales bacterium]|nr:hypothetical protein [Sedimentisphaerales bacterium]
MAKSIDIADAIVVTLNGHVFSPIFTAVRKLVPVWDIKDLKTLRVTVVPIDVEKERQSRSAFKREYNIDIGVQKKVSNDESEVPPLMTLVESIDDFISGAVLAGVTDVVFFKSHVLQLSAEHLMEDRVFSSVVRLTYLRIS